MSGYAPGVEITPTPPEPVPGGVLLGGMAQPLPPTDLVRNPLIPVFRDVLRRYGRITFVHVEPGELGDDRCGEVIATDDHAWIFLDGGGTVGEFTATVAHELSHLDHPEEDDDAVIESCAAELLIPLDEALAAITRDQIEAVARRHGVDSQLVRARVRTPAQPHRAN